MYLVDTNNLQLLVGYKDVFSDEIPNLEEEIKNINMHKAISIICELIRVRDAMCNPNSIFLKNIKIEFSIPFETVLKKKMCGIDPKSLEEIYSNPLFRKDVHIISVQMLLILLKEFIQYGNYETLDKIEYEITDEDYKVIIRLQLAVAEEINQKHSKEIDKNHFLYSTYHLNYQRNVAYEFSRMYYMMEKLSTNINNFDIDVRKEYKNYYSDFTRKYEITPTEYLLLLFSELEVYYSNINGLIYNKMWRNVQHIYEKTNKKEKINKLIEILSQQAIDLKKWAVESKDEEWNFSKFFEFPFIKDNKENYISISDITLRNAFFEKIYWLIRDCYPPNDSRAMAFFGRLFEKYVQELTESVSQDEYMYIKEFVYGNTKKKSSDAYIRKDDNLLVIEVKGFSVLLECMTKNKNIQKNLKKIFINPIIQADTCLAQVINEKQEFKGIDEAYIISVTMDNINAVPEYYDRIHKDIEKEKKCMKSKYYFNFNIEEYEMLMYLIEQKVDIFSLLKEYYNNDNLTPFSNYLLGDYPYIEMCTFIEDLYQEATERAKEFY